MKTKLLALAVLLVASTDAQSASVRDTDYCRAAGDWAEAEMTRRIENPDRRRLDAVDDFEATQKEESSYFTFLVNAIYDTKLPERVELPGLEEMQKKLDDLSRKFARDLAEDICAKEFLG